MNPGDGKTPAGPSHHSEERLLAIDGLRGFAIVLVLLFHIHFFCIRGNESDLWYRVLNQVARLGWVGVDLFFVLSGFLITRILWRARRSQDYYQKFYFRRTLRIFPLYYFAVLLFALVVPALQSVAAFGWLQLFVPMGAANFAYSLLYVVNWSIGLRGFPSAPNYMQHFWSLAIEEQFYLVWPLAVRKLGTKLPWLCAFCILASLALRVLCFQWGSSTAAYVLTVCRLDGLCLGALLALAIEGELPWHKLQRLAPWVAMLAGGFPLAMVARNGWASSFMHPVMGTLGITSWALFFAALLVLLLSADASGWLPRIFSTSGLRFFGKYSYGIYMWHQPVAVWFSVSKLNSLYFAEKLGSPLLGALAMFLVAGSVSVACALFTWKLFEERCIGLKDRYDQWFAPKRTLA